jgi:hypothetical protein
MIKFRPLLAAGVALVFYGVSDILVWQRIFEANQMVGYANSYHTGWIVSLAGYAALGVILLSDRWKDCVYFLLALFIGAFSGLEDVLYYVLDGKPIPDSLPWLEGNPLIYASSRAGVISSVFFWIAALLLLFVALYFWRRGSGPAIPLSSNRAKYR